MTAEAATTPIGSAMRIAPAFTAHTRLDDVEVTVQSTYSPTAGRYLITEVATRGLVQDADVNLNVLRKLPVGSIIQAAAPRCIAITLEDEHDPAAQWITISELSSIEGRIIPTWLAAQVVVPGNEDARMEAIEILYGATALAGIAPVKTIAEELSIPHRTASDWVKRARAAGRLDGMRYHVGRKANG